MKNISLQLPTIIILFVFIQNNALSACDPDTVQFYLDKGFNQDQITQLCSPATNTPTYEPFQKPVVIYQEGAVKGKSGEESKAINILTSSLAARSIEVTDQSINFITPVCIRGGQSQTVQERIEHCIDIAFSIARAGLTVKSSGQSKLIFGARRLNISSSEIKRKHITADPFGHFAPDLRFLLKTRYEHDHQGNEMKVTIINNASLPETANAFKVLAAVTASSQDGKSEVGRVLEDSYEAPTQKEYESTKPKIPNAASEKKGRWWNPFD